MDIKIFEPATNDILTREDVARMKLPFTRGWDTWLVTSPTGRILGRHPSYLGALIQTQISRPLAA